MKRVFGVKKDKEPTSSSSSSIQDAYDRITKRGDILDEKIKKLDAELSRYKEQIKKTRPGPAQEAVKARAIRALKRKRIYEGQRDMLYNRTFNLDQVTFAAEGVKEQTNLQYEMMDLMMQAMKSRNPWAEAMTFLMTLMRRILLVPERDAIESDMVNETEAEMSGRA